MKTKFFCLCLCMALTGAFKAQVKIGTNPNTITANSLLELESSTKGFLPPRVALTSFTAASPLSGTIAAGMTVFSTGGSVADGYYYWNGSKWLALNTSTAKSNYVLVKSAGDFPAAVGGIITLVAGTLYEINGTVSLASKINLNNSMIAGQNWRNDKLVYTGGSELFTGANGGVLNGLSLTASGKLFNIDAAGGTNDLLVYNCFMIGCNSIGIIKSAAGIVSFQSVLFDSNAGGITFQDIDELYEVNNFWESNNSGTYETFLGTFDEIVISGGDRGTKAANSAVAMDVSGISSVVYAASLKGVLFSGTGTYVTGSFSNAWDVESNGLNTEKDDEAAGSAYITSTITTVMTTANTPVKVLGTTASASLFRVTSPMSNRLTYVGKKSRRSIVNCSLTSSFVSAGSGKYFSFYIAKNGIILPESKQKVKLLSNTDQGPLSVSCLVSLAPNDYVEVWVENNSDGTNLIVQNLNLSLK